MTTILAPIINLADMPEPPIYPTKATLRPLITGDANRDLRTAFRLHDEGKARQAAYDHAVRAGLLQQADAHPFEVFRALASAETAAPADARPWHAARLDTWTAVHGIRGWYRRTNHHGQHGIVADRLRLSVDGEHGRYYSHAAAYMHLPLNHWVIDRDTGRTVYRTYAGGIAQQWIDEHERHTP